jgi:hypothetical protein
VRFRAPLPTAVLEHTAYVVEGPNDCITLKVDFAEQQLFSWKSIQKNTIVVHPIIHLRLTGIITPVLLGNSRQVEFTQVSPQTIRKMASNSK